jgi:uncharacterized oligopeptide transporter (OPT) family protein
MFAMYLVFAAAAVVLALISTSPLGHIGWTIVAIISLAAAIMERRRKSSKSTSGS